MRGIGGGVLKREVFLAEVRTELLDLHTRIATRITIFIVEPDFDTEFLSALARVTNQFEPAIRQVRNLISRTGVEDNAPATASLHGFELFADDCFGLDTIPEPEGVNAGAGL